MIETTDTLLADSDMCYQPACSYRVGPDWIHFLNRMRSLNLDQLQAYALMRRFDSKYLLAENELMGILQNVTEAYAVLEVNGVRLNPYLTTYYDTPDFRFFREHHNGKRRRCKVRTRTYLSSETSFLEVKQKGFEKQSIKQRMPIRTPALDRVNESDGFIRKHSHVPGESLEIKLHNRFNRFTLVNLNSIERVTVDLDLAYLNDTGKIDVPGVAIVEVKRADKHTDTVLVRALRAAHCHPQGFSKYCTGISLMESRLKHNRFKKKLLKLQKMTSERRYSYAIH